MLTIGIAFLIFVCMRDGGGRIAPLDRKDLERHRRLSDQKCRDWLYPFE